VPVLARSIPGNADLIRHEVPPPPPRAPSYLYVNAHVHTQHVHAGVKGFYCTSSRKPHAQAHTIAQARLFVFHILYTMHGQCTPCRHEVVHVYITGLSQAHGCGTKSTLIPCIACIISYCAGPRFAGCRLLAYSSIRRRSSCGWANCTFPLGMPSQLRPMTWLDSARLQRSMCTGEA